MYSGSYGFPNAAAGVPAGSPFNGAPHSQHPHLQPGQSPAQPHQMMYNPQQFSMAAQGSFPGAGHNPAALMAGAGPAAMMQNATAMPHMAANGQSKPFRSSLFVLLSLSFSFFFFFLTLPSFLCPALIPVPIVISLRNWPLRVLFHFILYFPQEAFAPFGSFACAPLAFLLGGDLQQYHLPPFYLVIHIYPF